MSKRIGSKSWAPLFVALAGACFSGQAIADETHVAYDLAAGATSALITVPIVNSPVMLSCTQNAEGNVGEGQATIINSNRDGLLDWVGYDYFTGAVSRGYSATSGTHIIWCDFGGSVDIEVGSATQIKVHNKAGSTQVGQIMFVY